MTTRQELEMAVLGACLIDPEAAERAHALLNPQDFDEEANQIIMWTIKHHIHNGHRVDQLTIGESLHRWKRLERVGGVEYLADLACCVATAANFETHAQAIQRHITPDQDDDIWEDME